MKALTLLLTLLVTAPVFADNFNPDAGKLMRTVCYSVRTQGDLSTRDPHFAIVINQEVIEKDNKKYDASNFVPGNRNFKIESAAESVFTVLVYKNVSATVTAIKDPQAYAEALMEQPESLKYPKSEGGRFVNGYSFLLGEGAMGDIEINLDNQKYSFYNDHTTHDVRFLHCETPFGVEDPAQAPAPSQDPQTTELYRDGSGTTANF